MVVLFLASLMEIVTCAYLHQCCLAVFLITRHDSRLLQCFFLSATYSCNPEVEDKESCMGATLACDVAASSASSPFGGFEVQFSPIFQAVIQKHASS